MGASPKKLLCHIPWTLYLILSILPSLVKANPTSMTSTIASIGGPESVPSISESLTTVTTPSLTPLQINDASKATPVRPWRKEQVCVPIDGKSFFKFGNTVESLRYLQNCTVIEGSLQVVWFIQNVSAENYTKAALTNLYEITGYLLTYRIMKLETLGVLFPNLRAIRGLDDWGIASSSLGYGLIVYELEDLTALSMPNLRYLGKGYLAHKNPQLCYNERIEWSGIINGFNKDKLDFYGNADDEMCSTLEDCSGCDGNCWNHHSFADSSPWWNTVCPKLCNKCRKSSDNEAMVSGCDANGDCCHEQCLGGCAEPNSPYGCYVCNEIFYEGECMSECPENNNKGIKLYAYKNRRCITAQECIAYHKLNKLNNGKCVFACPPGYIDHAGLGASDGTDLTVHSCRACEGTCDKVCPGGTFTMMHQTRSLIGCTIIENNLEFLFAGKGNVTLLEESTKMIHTVRGHIRLVRSHRISSMSFLPKLTRIVNNDNSLHALYISDNENLEVIWDLKTHPSLTINNGSIFIQQNPNLCYSHIKEFLDETTFLGSFYDPNTELMVNVSNATHNQYDISNKTNGHYGMCFLNHLNLTLSIGEFNSLQLNFSAYIINDMRHLISYIIYWRELDENETVSYYSSKDACDDEAAIWNVDEITNQGQFVGRTHFLHDIFYVFPYKRYAAYVQTFTQQGRMAGAISSIEYIRTNPSWPTSPTIQTVTSLDPGDDDEGNIGLQVNWDPPLQPNGIIDHYEIFYRKKPWPMEAVYRKNFCDYDKSSTEKELPKVTEAPTIEQNTSCPTEGEKEIEKNKRSEERERAEFRLLFENDLQNLIFEKNSERMAADSSKTGSEDHATTSASTNSLNAILSNTSDDTSILSDRQKRYVIRARRQVMDPLATGTSTLTTPQMRLSSMPMTSPTTPGDPDATTPGDPDATTTTEAPIAASVLVAASMVYRPANTTNALLFDLEPYTEYIIEILACQAYNAQLGERFCSKRATKSAFTRPIKSLDIINSSSIVVTHIKSEVDKDKTKWLNISWEKPKATNGPILSYYMEHYSLTSNSNTTYPNCIRPKHQFDDNNGSYFLDVADFKTGRYAFRIQVRTFGQRQGGNFTTPIEFEIQNYDQGAKSPIWPIIVGVLMALAIVIAIVGFLWFRYNKNKIPDQALVSTLNTDYFDTDYIYTPDEWEIDRAKIKIGETIGSGGFGMVYRGVAVDLPKTESKNLAVAIKTNSSNNPQEGINFLNEATRMKAMDCHHIVRLLAVVSQGNPKLVVMELMAMGDLKNYLRMHRPDEPDNDGRKPPTLQKILQMAAEIADGMCYLADKKYVHRDLAARNCMVGADMTVKIGDFGMTRDIYETDYYRKGGRGFLPVRWMSPESLRDGVYTCKSDVWSYGVVLWEMATLATQPYPGLSHDEVYNYVVNGSVMEMPDRCPEKLFTLMKECWQYFPKYRPTFQEIIEKLQGDVKKTFFQVSWYYTQRGSDSISHRSDSLEELPDEMQPLNPSCHEPSEPYSDDEDSGVLHGEPNDKLIDFSQTNGDCFGPPPEKPLKPRELAGAPIINGVDHSDTDSEADDFVTDEAPSFPPYTSDSRGSCNGGANGTLPYTNHMTTTC